eukprot:6193929-Pleurochrysis_carterae.AAC.1
MAAWARCCHTKLYRSCPLLLCSPLLQSGRFCCTLVRGAVVDMLVATSAWSERCQRSPSSLELLSRSRVLVSPAASIFSTSASSPSAASSLLSLV